MVRGAGGSCDSIKHPEIALKIPSSVQTMNRLMVVVEKPAPQ